MGMMKLAVLRRIECSRYGVETERLIQRMLSQERTLTVLSKSLS
jgi:hypothetical protein